MRNMGIGFILVVALVGCDQPAADEESSNTAQEQSTEAGANTAPVESQLAPSEIPKTPEALKDEFVRRFNEDNYAAFRDLSYWEGVPQDVRRKDMKIATMGFGKHRLHVTSAHIKPCSPDEFQDHFKNIDFPAVPNLTPTHVLEFESEWKGDDEEWDINGSCPVGTKDGGYYLCAGTLPN